IFASVGNLTDGLSTSCSSTSTDPAMTMAWALVRESASPRSTRSLSMRSRCMEEIVAQERACQKPERKRGPVALVALPEGRASDTLASHTLHDRPRCFTHIEFRRAFPAQPHQHPRRVNPIKRRNLAGYF